MRDEFSQKTKRILAARAGYRCSRAECRAPTIGPQTDRRKTVSVGVAAHICGASSGGPRYDRTMAPEDRSDVANGIWLCQTCAKLIDTDPARFSSTELVQWKQSAELDALARIGIADGKDQDSVLSPEEIELLHAAGSEGELWTMSSTRGKWIRSGVIDFGRDEGPSAAATYIDAFEALTDRKFIRHVDGSCFTLTGRGFRVATTLAGQSPDASDGGLGPIDKGKGKQHVPRPRRKRTLGTALTISRATSYRIENISVSGALLQADGPVETGRILDLSLCLDDGNEVCVVAKVVRVQEPAWGRVAGIGVAFTEFKGGDREVLQKWVEKDV